MKGLKPTMETSINFKGAFYIKNPTAELKNAITPVLKKKDLVYQDLKQKGDILYVTATERDKDVANVMLYAPNLKFKYYSTLNPKSGFIKNDTSNTLSILKNFSDNVITAKNKLLAVVRTPVDLTNTSIRRIHEKNLKTMQKETFLNFEEDKYVKNIDVQTGMCSIKLKGTKRKILEITPPGKNRICYAKYTPESLNEPTRRIALKDGKNILEYEQSTSGKYIDSISSDKYVALKFKENFDEAKKYYAEKSANKDQRIN